MQKLKLAACVLCFSMLLIPFAQLSAQVTIGADMDPMPGAVLDLKENASTGVNSTKGLLLPRVSLQSLTSIAPLLSGADLSDPALLAQHAGAVVYNLSTGADYCPGIYSWNGTSWVGMTECLTLVVSPGTLTIPANVGGANPTGLVNISWTPAYTSVAESVTALSGGGISFQTDPTATWTTGTASQTLQINAMTAAEVAVDPFLVKSSRIDFDAALLPATITKSVVVTQTNYALVVSGNSSPYVVNGSTYTFNVKSNAAWTATLSDNAGGAITQLLTLSGGNNTTTGDDVQFVTSSVPTSGTGTITFTSANGEFAPVVVNIVCTSI